MLRNEFIPYSLVEMELFKEQRERINDVLKTVQDLSTVDWEMEVDHLQLKLNNTVNTPIGETFHFLLHGCQKRMPLTLLGDARPPKPLTNYSFVFCMKTQTFMLYRKQNKELRCCRCGFSTWYNNYF